ncbi:MAG: LamG domain-containing protein [Planctomycetes bacterium]|nr:LamG domain-containing protein [Planctomycetota bacterium]
MKDFSAFISGKVIICTFCLAVSSCILFASVKSTSGTIDFEISDNVIMSLNSTGLGIGGIASSNLSVTGNMIVSEKLIIGGSSSSSSSNLLLNGTLAITPEVLSSGANLDNSSMYLVSAASDNISLILPNAGNFDGRQVSIKVTDISNHVWLSASSSLIDGLSGLDLYTTSDIKPYINLFASSGNWFTLSSSNYTEGVASDNVLIWWKLDETSGTTVSDSSGGGVVGTISGLSLPGSSVSGRNGGAMYFDGSDDYITANAISGNLTQISFSCWFYHSNDQWDTLVDIDHLADGYSNVFQIGPKGSGSGNKLHFELMDFGVQIATDEFPYQNWYHIVATWSDDGTRLVYKNGEIVSSASGKSVGESIYFDNVVIGGRHGGGGSFSGNMDDFRLYDIMLSDDEVNALYDLGR